MFKLAFRSQKLNKVQPTNGPDLRAPSEESAFVDSNAENCFQLRTCQHSFQEESSDGTHGDSKSSVKDSLPLNPSSIEGIHKQLKTFRLLIAALVVFSFVFFALNIWVIHEQRNQSSDSSLNTPVPGMSLKF